MQKLRTEKTNLIAKKLNSNASSLDIQLYKSELIIIEEQQFMNLNFLSFYQS
jgi:hypothetical protein